MAIIHPGKWRNADEPELEDLIKRAEMFKWIPIGSYVSGRCGSWMILAQSIAVKPIPARGVGSSPGATTSHAVLASTAIAAESIRGAKVLEQRTVTVDLDKIVGADISSTEQQEAGRVDFPGVRHEQDAVSIPDAKSTRHWKLGNLCHRPPSPDQPLHQNATGMWRLSGLVLIRQGWGPRRQAFHQVLGILKGKVGEAYCLVPPG